MGRVGITKMTDPERYDMICRSANELVEHANRDGPDGQALADIICAAMWAWENDSASLFRDIYKAALRRDQMSMFEPSEN